VLAALAVVLALFAGGAVTWLVTERWDSGGSDRRADPTPTASPTASPSNDAVVRRHEAITQLLSARAAAILHRDKPAFLALIDDSATRFKRRQATIFDRMRKVPFDSWEYDFAGEGPRLTDARAATLPSGAWVARVVQRFSYAGSGSSIERQLFLTVAPRGKDYLFVGDADGGAEAASFRFGSDVWELGPVNVVKGRLSLVVGEAKRAVLREYARQSDQSVRDVGKVWTEKWSRHPLVIVPRTQADMARIIGASSKGLGQIAAVTTGYSSSGLTQGDRVVVNPAAWRKLGELGRRVVMTHEVTHLATRAVTYGSVPIWLSEGFADYVAYDAVDIPVGVVAEQVLGMVRDGKGPRELPVDSDFDATRGDVSPAYEASWLAARMIADRYGEKKLVRLYVLTADRDDETVSATLRSVIGISDERLVRNWRAYMKDLAR
jgi:hypothetical protein